MFSIRGAMTVAAALVALSAGDALAQHNQGSGGGMNGGMGMSGGMGMKSGSEGMQCSMAMMQERMGGMAAIHAFQPARLLEAKGDLGLTPAQVASLESLAKNAPAEEAGMMAEHHASMDDFVFAADARAVLTAAQRSKVEAGLREDHHMGHGAAAEHHH